MRCRLRVRNICNGRFEGCFAGCALHSPPPCIVPHAHVPSICGLFPLAFRLRKELDSEMLHRHCRHLALAGPGVRSAPKLPPPSAFHPFVDCLTSCVLHVSTKPHSPGKGGPYKSKMFLPPQRGLPVSCSPPRQKASRSDAPSTEIRAEFTRSLRISRSRASPPARPPPPRTHKTRGPRTAGSPPTARRPSGAGPPPRAARAALAAIPRGGRPRPRGPPPPTPATASERASPSADRGRRMNFSLTLWK